MYLPHYLLTASPFQISTDPRFLWLGEDHQEALANFKYGLSEGNGFVMLVGPVGTGKTTLVNALLEMLDERVIVAHICHPGLEAVEFLAFVAHAYDPAAQVSSKSDCLNFFKSFLQKAHAEGKRVLLVIDEAHRLSVDLLEEIRLLSNLEQNGSKLINIFFIGQTELLHKLRTSACSALRQRVTLFYHLRPLTAAETEQYIFHRLRVAGCARRLFSEHALLAIHGYTRGYPRLINKLCDRALLTGYVRDRSQVDAGIIRECAREMRRIDSLPGPLGRSLAMVFNDYRWSWAEEWRQWPWVGNFRRWAQSGAHAFSRGASLLSRQRALAWMLALAFLAAALISGWKSMPHVEREIERATRMQGSGAPAEKPPAGADAVSAALPESVPTPSPASIAPPERPSPWTQALTWMKQGNYKEALALMEAQSPPAADQAPAYAQALVGRAGQLMDASPEEARSLLEKAVAADSRNAEALYNLGFLYAAAGNYAAAETMLTRVVALKPVFLDKALFNLAVVQQKLGKARESVASLETALSVRPENQKAQAYLKRLKSGARGR